MSFPKWNCFFFYCHSTIHSIYTSGTLKPLFGCDFPSKSCVLPLRVLAERALPPLPWADSGINKAECRQCFHKLSTKDGDKFHILTPMKIQETMVGFCFNISMLQRKKVRKIIRIVSYIWKYWSKTLLLILEYKFAKQDDYLNKVFYSNRIGFL